MNDFDGDVQLFIVQAAPVFLQYNYCGLPHTAKIEHMSVYINIKLRQKTIGLCPKDFGFGPRNIPCPLFNDFCLFPMYHCNALGDNLYLLELAVARRLNTVDHNRRAMKTKIRIP